MCQLVTLCHPGLTYIFNFRRTGTLALRPERQSARMSEIKNVGSTWMVLNTFKRNCLTPLYFRRLMDVLWNHKSRVFNLQTLEQQVMHCACSDATAVTSCLIKSREVAAQHRYIDACPGSDHKLSTCMPVHASHLLRRLQINFVYNF